MKKILLLITLMMGLILIYLYTQNIEKEYSKSMFYMDTYINVKIYSNDSKKAELALNEVEKIYKEYHKLTDRYNSYKEITNIYTINNNVLKDEYLKIDTRLYDLIDYSKKLYQKSNGKIDITMGNVIDVWKSYRESKIGIPTYEELKSVDFKDINKIILKDSNLIKNNNLNLDLGCISKGYTTEKVGKYLKKININKFLINAGGNVFLGEHYNNGKYKVGLENPSNKNKEIYKIINVKNKAVVTSGGYERFYEFNGNKYHHIIDPNTLFPSNNMKSVTVITSDSGYADFLSTTLFLMSVEDGIKYVNELNDVEAIWYKNDNTTITSKGFKKYE